MSNCSCKDRGLASLGNPIDDPENFTEYFPEPFFYIEVSSGVIRKVSEYAGMNIIEYSEGLHPIRRWHIIRNYLST